MRGARKLLAAFSLYDAVKKNKAARLRQQHPDWSEQQIRQEVNAIFMHAVT